MITEQRRQQLGLLWAKEPESNDTSWRKKLTPEEAAYVASMDNRFPAFEEKMDQIKKKHGIDHLPVDFCESMVQSLDGYLNGDTDDIEDLLASYEDEQDDSYMVKPKREIPLTEELLAKISRFSQREGKVVASKFNRFAAAVQKADFKQTDPKSYYEARDFISHLAEKYGLSWMKLDSDHVCWQYEKIFKIDQEYFVGFAVGYDIDYYGEAPEKLWNILSAFVVEKFGAMTKEEATKNIEDFIISSIKDGEYFD